MLAFLANMIYGHIVFRLATGTVVLIKEGTGIPLRQVRLTKATAVRESHVQDILADKSIVFSAEWDDKTVLIIANRSDMLPA